MSIIFEQSVNAEAAAVPTMRRGVSDALQRHGINGDALRANVALALSEAVTNAVLHAYPDAATSGSISVTVEHTADAVTVRVKDTGVGVSDSSAPGLGLHLIEQLAADWSITSTPTTGTTFTMRFLVAGHG